jgi:zinc D-Ala-D-Ala carboxypeptidase
LTTRLIVSFTCHDLSKIINTIFFSMPNAIQGNLQNIKFKKDYKILGRKSTNRIGLKSKILFVIAILALGLSSVVFVNSYNNFLSSNNNLPGQKQVIPVLINSSLIPSISIQSSTTKSSDISSGINPQIAASIISSQSAIGMASQSSQNGKSEEPKVEVSSSATIVESPKITLRVLSGAEFQQIYESTQYQNVSDSINPTVTDVPDVDNYIKALAEKRGYKLRPQAIEHYLIATDGFLLQQPASDGWITLKQAATREGVNLVLTSGYRSIASQKSIFAADLAPEYQVADVLSGKVDGALNKVMNRASVPGYSRHHTGYTIDVSCGGEGTVFKNTSCYQWMKKDNFAQARLAGYIPSYPEGANLQGPNPEEWEFVWVGDSK